MSTNTGVRESRVLYAADGVECEPFALPAMEQGRANAPGPLAPLTARQLETLQREAYQEAFDRGRQEGDKRGYAEGLQRADNELKPLLANLQGLLRTLAKPLESLDEEVEQNLLALAFACARQIVRRELRSDPGEVVAAVREALAALPMASRSVQIHLNRADLGGVREALGGDSAEAPWGLLEDPSLSAGGCRVHSEYSRIDASVEGRLNAIFAQVLGGERSHDGEDSVDG